MKNTFSKFWISSKQVRKQRKFRANAPLNIKRKFLSVNLDKPLRQKYKMRNVEVRKGDEVKIMRGKFNGKQGKVSSTDSKNSRVVVEGIQITKKDGTKVSVSIHASNLKIIVLETSDKLRFKNREEKKEQKTENKIKENKK